MIIRRKTTLLITTKLDNLALAQQDSLAKKMQKGKNHDPLFDLNKLHASNLPAPRKKRRNKGRTRKGEIGLFCKEENLSTSFPTSLPFFDWKEGYIPSGIVGSSLCWSQHRNGTLMWTNVHFIICKRFHLKRTPSETSGNLKDQHFC